MEMDNDTKAIDIGLRYSVDVVVLSSVAAQARIPSTVVAVLLLFVGLVGNSFVIYIYTTKITRKYANSYYIPWLALFDICACVIGSTLSLLQNYYSLTFPDETLCRIFWVLTWMSTGVPASLLLLISIQRYKKICHPFKNQMDLRWRKICLVIVVIFAFSLAIPVGFLVGKRPITISNSVTGYSCGPLTDHNLKRIGYVYFVTCFCIILVNIFLACVFYGKIIQVIYKTYGAPVTPLNNPDVRRIELPSSYRKKGHTSNERAIEDASQNNGNSVRADKTREEPENIRKNALERRQSSATGPEGKFSVKLRFTVMFVVVVIVYTVSYLPTLIFLLLPEGDQNSSLHDQNSSLKLNGILILHRMFIVSHVANPFIYLFFHTRFRHELLNLFYKGY